MGGKRSVLEGAPSPFGRQVERVPPLRQLLLGAIEAVGLASPFRHVEALLGDHAANAWQCECPQKVCS